jgi:hypothetical protein
MSDGFMATPTKVMLKLLGQRGMTAHERLWFGYGRLAVCLEMLSAVKVLESFAVEDERVKEAVISALQTLMTEMGLLDQAESLYEELAEWRRPRFVPYGNGPEP